MFAIHDGFIHAQIREDIHHHGIHIYPSAYPHEDDEDAQASAKYEVRVSSPLPVLCYDIHHVTRRP